jgi:hypothetical protein
MASPAGAIGKHWTHPCFQQQAAVWFGSQRMSVAVLVQCTIHNNLHFKNSITRLLFRQLAMAPEGK